MKKNNKETMLDLSFLTEEEYEKLMKVLQRDEELKKKDSDRIRRLQGSLKDEKKKKFVTGEWFEDVKAKRFEEDLHGSDLLRASIRKKKSRTQNETCRDGNESEDSGPGSSPPDAPPCILTESSPDLSNDRFSGNKEVDYTEGPRVLPKPKVRPPVLQSMPTSCLPDKKYSLTEVSPADSGIGLSPFVLTDNSQPPEKGHYTLPSSPTKLPEKEVVQPSPATQWDISVDTATKKGSQEESATPSKIPVKRKPTKGLSKSEVILDNLAECDPNLKKTESLPSSALSSPDAENKILKQGSHFTVFALKDKPKEQETIVDRDHFRTLKSFWERAAESPTVNNMSDLEPLEKQNSSESNGRQFFPLNRSISVQSDKSQNGEEKSSADLPHRTRHPFKRAVTPSSSEDEPLYIHVPHSRKGASSSAPRSTYGRSKAASVALKGITFAERNGRHNGTEENRSPNRHSKKSKLPVRAASVQLDTRVDAPIAPMKERLQSVSEPETPSPTPDEELIVPEHVQKRAESLQSKVRILIDTATTDEEREKASDLAACDYMEQRTLATNGELTEQCEAADNTADTDDDSPVAMALARANSLSNARSMVNIYTTTETYNKPQTTQQRLDPERAKELSKSTPALLSETESDTASEISFQFNRHRKTQSSGSHSSDMASVSSISNSVLSVYSGDFGSVDAQGMAQFALDYDEKNREFQIFIAQCNDLAVVDEKKGRSDPYVKTYLLPDKARMGKRKTSVKKRTLNPVYNEILRYKIEKMVLLIQKLNLSVWHNDPLGRNSFLGEIEIDLASWDWSNKKLNWYTLKPRSLSAINGVDHRGVMNLSIRYIPPGSLGPKNPSSGEVHIWVKDTKDLPQLRPSGVDSFVKCYVLPDTSKKSYQKTRVIKKDPNPVFNHTIVYDGFHTEDLKDACVELTVWDHEKLTNHFLGGIRLGLGTGKSYGIPVDWMDSTQEEIAFWQEMMSAPSEWHEGSLLLRSLAGKRKFK